MPTDEHLRHALIVGRADAERAPLAVDFRIDEFRARTEMLLYAADHPGLFMKVAGALALSGVSIVDAHIFTTIDGMALDTLGFQDADDRGSPSTDPARLGRIRDNIEKALRGEIWLEKALAGRRCLPKRADVFEVEPRVLIDNTASRTHSVIEVNGRDRPGLLFDLAKTLKDLGPGDPQRPHQHLWRARGRRVLRQGRVRPEDRPAQQDAAGADGSWPRR